MLLFHFSLLLTTHTYCGCVNEPTTHYCRADFSLFNFISLAWLAFRFLKNILIADLMDPYLHISPKKYAIHHTPKLIYYLVVFEYILYNSVSHELTSPFFLFCARQIIPVSFCSPPFQVSEQVHCTIKWRFVFNLHENGFLFIFFSLVSFISFCSSLGHCWKLLLTFR